MTHEKLMERLRSLTPYQVSRVMERVGDAYDDDRDHVYGTAVLTDVEIAAANEILGMMIHTKQMSDRLADVDRFCISIRDKATTN